jgi:hypothetical protein
MVAAIAAMATNHLVGVLIIAVNIIGAIGQRVALLLLLSIGQCATLLLLLGIGQHVVVPDLLCLRRHKIPYVLWDLDWNRCHTCTN